MTGGTTIKANSAGPRRTPSTKSSSIFVMEQRQFMAPRAEGELGPFGPGPTSSLEELTDSVDGGDRAINSQVIAACPRSNKPVRSLAECIIAHSSSLPF